MPHTSSLLAFALVSLGIVLTPGPNMVYLISRSITQGPEAGIVSLGGVALGFVFYMLCAAFGITALLFAVPYAYDALRLAGADPAGGRIGQVRRDQPLGVERLLRLVGHDELAAPGDGGDRRRDVGGAGEPLPLEALVQVHEHDVEGRDGRQ